MLLNLRWRIVMLFLNYHERAAKYWLERACEIHQTFTLDGRR